MSIPVRHFDPERAFDQAQIFSGSVEDDPWMIFHGTSGYSSDAIEKDGFRFLPSAIPHDALRRVAGIFEGIKWAGDSSGGYPVLKPFSLDHDYSSGASSPVFFAEASSRALLYATEDFAGGEKLRALRIAIRDLDAYLNESELRALHRKKMAANFASLSRLNASAETLEAARPVNVDLDWLEKEVAALEDVRQLAEAARTKFAHGAVYAVRVTVDDLDGLHFNSTMGIEASKAIPPSKIVEKAIVPASFAVESWAEDGLDRIDRMGKGLLMALGQKSRK